MSDYGEEFSQLNGFGDSQLSYTDFIQSFIDAEAVADASVDGSANVKDKDMRTLMNEMPKAHRKLLAYNKIYYERIDNIRLSQHLLTSRGIEDEFLQLKPNNMGLFPTLVLLLPTTSSCYRGI